jgi:alkaline phosphatase isozyme conversion protein
MQIIRKLLSLARFGLIVLALLAAVLPVSACSSSDQKAAAIANYGTYGSDLALKFAAEFPFRSPGSAQETAAGDFLIKSFKEL